MAAEQEKNLNVLADNKLVDVNDSILGAKIVKWLEEQKFKLHIKHCSKFFPSESVLMSDEPFRKNDSSLSLVSYEDRFDQLNRPNTDCPSQLEDKIKITTGEDKLGPPKVEISGKFSGTPPKVLVDKIGDRDLNMEIIFTGIEKSGWPLRTSSSKANGSRFTGPSTVDLTRSCSLGDAQSTKEPNSGREDKSAKRTAKPSFKTSTATQESSIITTSGRDKRTESMVKPAFKTSTATQESNTKRSGWLPGKSSAETNGNQFTSPSIIDLAGSRNSGWRDSRPGEKTAVSSDTSTKSMATATGTAMQESSASPKRSSWLPQWSNAEVNISSATADSVGKSTLGRWKSHQVEVPSHSRDPSSESVAKPSIKSLHLQQNIWDTQEQYVITPAHCLVACLLVLRNVFLSSLQTGWNLLTSHKFWIAVLLSGYLFFFIACSSCFYKRYYY